MGEGISGRGTPSAERSREGRSAELRQSTKTLFGAMGIPAAGSYVMNSMPEAVMRAVESTTTMKRATTGDAAGTAMPGELFGYEILGVLGQGAGSTIYAASHPQTRQICALKHVVVANDKAQRFVDQLRAEFEVGQKVRHPGLRKCINLKVKSSWLGKVSEAALVMEMVEG